MVCLFPRFLCSRGSQYSRVIFGEPPVCEGLPDKILFLDDFLDIDGFPISSAIAPTECSICPDFGVIEGVIADFAHPTKFDHYRRALSHAVAYAAI
jgi:hypothetical protein